MLLSMGTLRIQSCMVARRFSVLTKNKGTLKRVKGIDHYFVQMISLPMMHRWLLTHTGKF